MEDEPDVEQPHLGRGVIPATPFRWILSGPSKSGKSNLARWSLDKYYTSKVGDGSFFDKVYLLSPTCHIDFLWSQLPGCEHKHRIAQPTPKHLKGILDSQIRKIAGSSSESALRNINPATLARRKQSSDKVLVIFDDAIAESKLINSPEFLKIFIQGRHYNISSMVMTQSYMRVPRSVRLQATHLSMFPSRSTEIDRVFTEFGPKDLSKNEFTEMVQYAIRPEAGDEFPFLHVDAFASEKVRFRRNFTNTLEIKENGNAQTQEVPRTEDGSSMAPPQKRRKNKRRRGTLPHEEPPSQRVAPYPEVSA